MSRMTYGICLCLLVGTAIAEYSTDNELRETPYGMEKCTVVDQDGNGLIKPGMANSGNNLENDADAWIYVPHGQCAKINKGDFNGVSPEIRNKLQAGDEIDNAATIE